MLCRMALLHRKKKTGKVPVYLNVYDLTPMNGYAYWIGLGIYHSGVQVNNVEYGFGAHDHSSTGIFEVEPRKCPGFTFRKSILIGRTDMDAKEIRALMEKLAREYPGNTYHLITKNCNHFCNDVCIKLTGKTIPPWVNRLARIGFLCNCVLPAELNQTKIRQVKSEDKTVGEKKKWKDRSNKLLPTSNGMESPSLTSSSSGSGSSRQGGAPPSIVHDTSDSTFNLRL